ncbi:hypothetical protein ACQY0O_001133 [Thecaphora frezii]
MESHTGIIEAVGAVEAIKNVAGPETVLLSSVVPNECAFEVDSTTSTLATPEDAIEDPMGRAACTSRQLPSIHTGPIPSFYSIIPAGGSGTRLWPLSRDARPKFLLDLEGNGASLLQNTWKRLTPLSHKESILVVTGNAHAPEVAEQLAELGKDNLIKEPCPKESMAAIGLAAAICYKRDPEAIVGSFAADHVMPTEQKNPHFYAAVREAVRVAQTWDVIVTIGITPTEPSTAFGYIHLGESVGAGSYRVSSFKEKPDAPTARRLLEQGSHCWNAGIFVASARVLLAMLRQHQPELHASLVELASLHGTEAYTEAVAKTWPSLVKISIDHAIAEPAAAEGKMMVVPAPLVWKDLGDFASLSEWRRISAPSSPGSPLSPASSAVQTPAASPYLAGGSLPDVSEQQYNEDPVIVLGDESNVFVDDATGFIVPQSGRIIGCIGLEDVVIVDTKDALLVMHKSRAQEIKQLANRCKLAFPTLS